MKRFIPAFIVLAIIIASALRVLLGGGDGSLPFGQDEKPRIPIDDALVQRVDSYIATDPHIGSLGVVLYDITADSIIYSYRGDTVMCPASCMKLLTCITALKKMGPNYQFRTRLYTQGTIANDTLYGDLILKTQFDPCFTRDSLYNLMKSVKKKGIKAVKGRMLLDVAFTEEMSHEEHWIPGDLKHRAVGLLYTGYHRLRKEVMASTRYFGGIQLPDSAFVMGRLDTRRAKMIGEIRTPILFPVARALNVSSNFNAEALLYPLGYTMSSKGNFRRNGVAALNDFVCNVIGMPGHAEVHDGCGLCPSDRLSPLLITRLLQYAHNHPRIFDVVYSYMPLSGTDGTLWDRMRSVYTKGRVKGKTGTLTREDGISTLSGYFVGLDKHLIAFSIMNNECYVFEGRRWQDTFFKKGVFAERVMKNADLGTLDSVTLALPNIVDSISRE